jgi:uncharacterized FlgJ-related protein
MAFDACNNLDAVAFVMAHRADCMLIAAMLKLPTENILGLAAHESQYGVGRIAIEYNNFFSLHAPHISKAVLSRRTVTPISKWQSFPHSLSVQGHLRSIMVRHWLD